MLRVVEDPLPCGEQRRGFVQTVAGARVAGEAGVRSGGDLDPEAVPGGEPVRGGPQVDKDPTCLIGRGMVVC
jgi:hypothetical protein